MTIDIGSSSTRVAVQGGPGGLWLVASGRGAAALTIDRGTTRRVAVWEPLRAEPAPALRARLAAQLERSAPADVVAWCRDEGASVVVAEVLGGREVQVVGWAAPSVLHVSTERTGLTPLPVPTVEPVSVPLRPGEMLVLCSPGLLVEPPTCLHAEAAAFCPAGGPQAWDWAWRGLVEPLREGAIALLQAT